MSPIVEFDFDYDKERLLAEANDLTGYNPFIDPLDGKVFDKWLIKRIETGYAQELSQQFSDMFGLQDCRPRFYIQKPGFALGFHKDRGTLCSFNFLLSDNLDVINFRGYNLFYRTALLDTQTEHAVLEVTSDRILFKLSVFDKTFEEIKDVLPFKLQSR